MDTGFLSLPMTAGRRDIAVAEDDAGNPVYMTPFGQRYTIRRQNPAQGSRVKAGLEVLKEASKAPLESLTAAAQAMAQGAWQGISAPGRAARGEPMTYGDVAGTAMDWGLMNAPGLAFGKYDPATVNMGIRAYHGSPHDFDRFDMSKIGTGEGAQAYGHGLYFAEAEDVAKGYREKLAGKEKPWNLRYSDRDVWGDAFYDLPPDQQRGMVELHARLSPYKDPTSPELLARTKQHLEATIQNFEGGYIPMDDGAYGDAKAALAVLNDPNFAVRPTETPGRMYEVDINADPADFLDWDAPLSEQPAKVQELAGISPDDKLRLQSIIDEMEAMGQDRLPNNRMREENRWFALARERDALAEKVGAGKRGDHLYNYLTNPSRSGQVGLVAEHQSRQRATDTMREAGIPGIKYYDQGSRASGQGTRNYVVFDDSIIDIVRKYGWATVAPMLGMAGQEEPQG